MDLEKYVVIYKGMIDWESEDWLRINYSNYKIGDLVYGYSPANHTVSVPSFVNYSHPYAKFVPFISTSDFTRLDSQEIKENYYVLILSPDVRSFFQPGTVLQIVGIDREMIQVSVNSTNLDSLDYSNLDNARLDRREIVLIKKNHKLLENIRREGQYMRVNLISSSEVFEFTTTNIPLNSNYYTTGTVTTSSSNTTAIISDSSGDIVETNPANTPVIERPNTVLHKDTPVELKPLKHKLNPFKLELAKLLLYHPEDYKKYLAKLDNPSYGARFINKLLPIRVGLEFDLVHTERTLPSSFMDEVRRLTQMDEDIPGYFEMYFEKDNHYNQSFELKITFKDIQGLIKFKRIVELLIEQGTKPVDQGGLHIHVDIRQIKSKLSYITLHNKKFAEYSYRDLLSKRSNIYLKYKKYILNAFNINAKHPEYEQIMGSKNYKFLNVGERTRISVNRRHETVEWRLANSTLDYTQIVKWIIFCIQMTMLVRNRHSKFNMNLYENIRRL